MPKACLQDGKGENNSGLLAAVPFEEWADDADSALGMCCSGILDAVMLTMPTFQRQ